MTEGSQDRDSLDYQKYFKLIAPVISRDHGLIASFFAQLTGSNAMDISNFFAKWNEVYPNFYYPLFLLIKKENFDSAASKILCDTLIKEYVDKNVEFSVF